MSSATPYTPGTVRKMLGALTDRFGKTRKDETPEQTMSRIARLGMSPRQQVLNNLWAFYCCENYSPRKVDWNGQQAYDRLESEAIASATFIPPGFYDAGQTMPLKFRKPTAPYALVRVIVDRFTGLLFSEKRHPFIVVEGDPETEEYVNVLLNTARLWPAMIQARAYGGSMGSVAIGFQFVDGKPVVEVHDPRWCVPKFEDRFDLRLESFEKRYMYPQDERNMAGQYQQVWYWYRRIINKTQDILFKSVPVGNGDEPQWEVERQVDHNFGFCPVVWLQNLPVQDSIDGSPDALGVFDVVETIDCLISQANKGILCNCDPTVVIVSDADMSEVHKGSDNAIKLPNGSAHYMEIAGSGPKAALELAEQLRKFALEVAQCVLDHPEMSQRTATEIERAYSSMLAKADIMREQYGQKGVLLLVDMMLRAIRQVTEAQVNPEDGTIERHEVVLPMKSVRDPETDNVTKQPYKLGSGGVTTLNWPNYFEPLLADVELAARAAIAAKTGGLVDSEHAVKFFAEYFQVDDVQAMLEKIREEQQQQQQQMGEGMANDALGMLNSPGVDQAGTQESDQQEFPELPTYEE